MNNIYTSLVDISAFQWLKTLDTNDLTNLVIDKSIDYDKSELQKAFKILNDELITKRGISDDYRNYIIALKTLNKAKSKWLLSNNNYDYTMMKIAETDIEVIQKNTPKKPSTLKTNITASRIIGYHINLKEINALEYYAYLDEADELARSMTKKN